jgi:hypothetical protein
MGLNRGQREPTSGRLPKISPSCLRIAPRTYSYLPPPSGRGFSFAGMDRAPSGSMRRVAVAQVRLLPEDLDLRRMLLTPSVMLLLHSASDHVALADQSSPADFD